MPIRFPRTTLFVPVFVIGAPVIWTPFWLPEMTLGAGPPITLPDESAMSTPEPWIGGNPMPRLPVMSVPM